jgi:hypothetical protein
MVTAPLRRELVRWAQTKGLSERRGLAIIQMSPSALLYDPDRTAMRICGSGSWPWPSGIVDMQPG